LRSEGVVFEDHLQVTLRDLPQRTFTPCLVVERPRCDNAVFPAHIHVADARPIRTVLGGVDKLQKPEELIQKVINVATKRSIMTSGISAR
jgi:hypothetical protein